MATKQFDLIQNYIYIYQLDKYCIIPSYPEQLTDTLGSTFAQTNALARTAPIYSYSYSGPRTVQITLQLHRDMLNDVNRTNLDFSDKVIALDDDYVDTLIKYLQAMALPSYKAQEVSSKTVNPPLVAIRFGNTLFVKGIISGDVQVTWSGGLTRNNKYQEANVTFRVLETDPQDADSIAKWGSFRGLETALTKGLHRKA